MSRITEKCASTEKDLGKDVGMCEDVGMRGGLEVGLHFARISSEFSIDTSPIVGHMVISLRNSCAPADRFERLFFLFPALIRFRYDKDLKTQCGQDEADGIWVAKHHHCQA